MKKALIFILAAALLILAACGKPDQEEAPKSPVTGTDLAVYEEDPLIKEAEGELGDLEDLLGTEIALPKGIEAERYTVIDDNMAQVEFSIGENSFVGRYAKGQQENLSGMTKDFSNTETVTVKGCTVTLRYADETTVSRSGRNFGVADAYDPQADMSFCVIEKSFSSTEDLSAAMEALMESVAQPADETTEPKTAGPSAQTEEEARLAEELAWLQESVCYLCHWD